MWILAAHWAGSRHVQVRAGCNNVLDKNPPFRPSVDINTAGSFNTLPAYDVAVREIYLAVHTTL
jgi:hypothetical protein